MSQEFDKIKPVWIHGTASVAEGAKIGQGTKIWRHCEVLEGATIGEDCVIGHNCTIFPRARLGNGIKLEANIDVWDGVIIKDHVFVGPSVVFTNDLTPRAAEPKKGQYVETLIEEGVSIGANATIVCGITLGAHAAVAAGAVVTHDVAPYSLVAGAPAKFIRHVCRCNRWGTLSQEGLWAGLLSCTLCGRRYRKTTSGLLLITGE